LTLYGFRYNARHNHWIKKMPSENSKIDKLSEILFDKDVKCWDIKTMPGTEANVDSETLADELLSSLKRVGLVSDDNLVDKNK